MASELQATGQAVVDCGRSLNAAETLKH